jgi:polar amino acid transport system substrate-binding protein
MNRRQSIQALGAALGAGFTRWASARATDAGGATPTAQAPTYSVGAPPTGIPFTYIEPKTNTMQGAMADVLRSIAADAGFGLSFESSPFPALIPALLMKRIDMIGAAMLVTAPRREAIDFSDPVFAYPEGLVANLTDKTPYRSLADLKGQAVGAQAGTIYADFVRNAVDTNHFRVYPSIADILREISQGRLAAGVGDKPILAYQLAQNVSLRAHLVPTYEAQLTGNIGIGVRKTDAELLKTINASLAKLRADGTIDTIATKWNLK